MNYLGVSSEMQHFFLSVCAWLDDNASNDNAGCVDNVLFGDCK